MKRRAFLERAAGAAAILPFLPIGATVSAPTRTDDKKPNLVWIWCDNLAYGDLGCYGNQAIKTPVIDSLAQSGTRLTQYYIAHTVCSPSRAALLTGRQPFRTGIVDVLRPDSPTGMPDDEITLGDALRAEG
ncbi:MAG TPA: sulfatase-like hydrolase/transferase, partial [Candidatus Hydrogenedentes bacterium]|nr:sulfatase-like hydrolase/transferase [Candidatus Hydrogenedentota bacterium]